MKYKYYNSSKHYELSIDTILKYYKLFKHLNISNLHYYDL